MVRDPYQLLAERLHSLPNGFPPTADGIELELLARLYTPEEAALAAQLRLALETPQQIAMRDGGNAEEIRPLLKSMARRGLIKAGRGEGGVGYGLMPFVVGIYEMQAGSLDAELAGLFERYHREAFGEMLSVQPAFHRVIPVGESVQVDLEIRPHESAADIVRQAKAWGVLDCICREEKALIGDPCHHPMDVCMVFSSRPNAFDKSSTIRAQTLEEALATLARAAEAGLVHSVSNTQRGVWYICNCCTCSCGILRGISEMGIANAVARSAFLNQVDEELCFACEDCLEHCQFDALSLEIVAQVDQLRCVGCGVCVQHCPEGALSLVRRPDSEIEPVPETELAWLRQRAAARNLDLDRLL